MSHASLLKIRARLMAERMLAWERIVAHPRDYMNGLSGGRTEAIVPAYDGGIE
jgi:hypothetical protein